MGPWKGSPLLQQYQGMSYLQRVHVLTLTTQGALCIPDRTAWQHDERTESGFQNVHLRAACVRLSHARVRRRTGLGLQPSHGRDSIIPTYSGRKKKNGNLHRLKGKPWCFNCLVGVLDNFDSHLPFQRSRCCHWVFSLAILGSFSVFLCCFLLTCIFSPWHSLLSTVSPLGFLVCPPLSLVVFFPCHLRFLSYAQKSNRSLLCRGFSPSQAVLKAAGAPAKPWFGP